MEQGDLEELGIVDDTTTKKCSKCWTIKDLREFRFRKDQNRHRTTCISCDKILSIEYRNKNRYKISERNKEKRKNDPWIKTRQKIYIEKHRERLRKQQRDYYKKNHEKCITWDREYKAKHKEKIARRQKIYQREYRLKNKDKINKYYKERKKTNIRFKLRDLLSKRILSAIKNQYGIKAVTTIKLLGCDIETIRKYLESKFQDGMSWENHGKGSGKWNIDHIIPCAAFDLTKEEEQRKCFHYSNLQPLWEIDNLIKSDKLPNGEKARDI